MGLGFGAWGLGSKGLGLRVSCLKVLGTAVVQCMVLPAAMPSLIVS